MTNLPSDCLDYDDKFKLYKIEFINKVLNKMSIPVLRKPKPIDSGIKRNLVEQQYIILTLKNSTKLVVSSDSFHGIITMGNVYKCVLCNVKMPLENGPKENHKIIPEHIRLLKVYRHIEDMAENLVRQIDNVNCYCTVCNVGTSTHFLMRHIKTDEHVHELNKAIMRASTYKPNND